MELFPEESQWELLTAAGLRQDFQAVWIEGDDLDAITAELRIDPAATLECDLATALRWNSMDMRTLILWMGGHSPGWTFALVLTGMGSDLNLPGRGSSTSATRGRSTSSTASAASMTRRGSTTWSSTTTKAAKRTSTPT
ncbi:hypothetical protein ACFQX6_19950 [Streptosporangium lutulentum]